jgi:hypothetical protein
MNVWDNVQPRMGPMKVTANSWRPVAEAAAERAKGGKDSDGLEEEKRALASVGPRCCNCGLVAESVMRLPVYDPQDSVVPAASTRPEERHDWVRIPLELEMAGARRFTLSDYVACTPACALRFMYDSTGFRPTHAVDLFHRMMRDRHRVDEPVNCAPPADALRYVNAWSRLSPPVQSSSSDSKASRIPESATKAQRQRLFTGHQLRRARALVEKTRWAEGLSARSFYSLLSIASIIGYKQRAPLIIPPHEGEDTALQSYDHRFTQYYFMDLLPPVVASDIKLPAGYDARGVQLDVNPDSDAETDFATGDIHAPPPPIPSSHSNPLPPTSS